MYNSQRLASREEQSANLPGKELISSEPFLRVASLAFLAAKRALAAKTTFP